MYCFKIDKPLIPLLLCLLLIGIFSPSVLFAQEGVMPTDSDDSFTAISAYPVGLKAGSIDMQIDRPLKPSYWSWRLGLSYGLLSTTEFMVNVPYAFDYDDQNGFQDITLALKQVLVYEKRYNPSVSLIVSHSFEGKEGISTGGAYGGGVLVTKKLGPFVGNINFLYFHPVEKSFEDEYQVRIGGNISVSHDFRTIVDVLVKKSFYANEIDHVQTRIGYAVSLSPVVTGYGGFGYDLKEDIESWNIFVRLNVSYQVK